MHLLIDLQACQTPGSRQRGIGRYSLALAQAMAAQAQARGHRVSLMLSDRFPDSVTELRLQFEPLVGARNIHLLALPPSVDLAPAPSRALSVQLHEVLRQQLISQVDPDVVHIASLFERPDAAASIASVAGGPLTAVTLYDLIPLQYPDLYLADPATRQWYIGRLHVLQCADLLLAISNSSRLEALEHLGVPAAQVVNISSAISAHFRMQTPLPAHESELRQRHGLRAGFVMYTGGIDHRKNLERLLDAYARLAVALRQRHQLVVVCSMQPTEKVRLMQVARRHGLVPDEVVFTGYVSDADLVALYNLATLFVFPSLHEGFGLPVLEAMACGTPTLGAANSSIPEVLGLQEALFDPTDTDAMADAIARALTDTAWRQVLRSHGLQQAQSFSWARSAGDAWGAIEEALAVRPAKLQVPPAPAQRMSLAFVSPWPPEASGIADYSARLVVALARHYDIELVASQPMTVDHPLRASFAVRDADWFRAHAGRFDRVIYHLGNSSFHAPMLGLLAEVPGLVVLHDCFLSGLMHYVQHMDQAPHAFDAALWNDHGPLALQHKHQHGSESAMSCYTTNRTALKNALGILTHSHWTVQRLARDYGPDWQALCRVVPFACQPRAYSHGRDRARVKARHALGLSADAFVVCSFGTLAFTKCNLQLLEAWQKSGLEHASNAQLVWVGQLPENDYGIRVERQQRLMPNVRFAGHVDAGTYGLWLDAADLAVQLRTASRGETSAAVFDALGHKLPLIYNAHGPAAELPEHVGWRLPDVDPDALTPLLAQALQALHLHPAQRHLLAQSGHQWVHHNHHLAHSAAQYHHGIEALYALSPAARQTHVFTALARCLQAAESLPVPTMDTLANSVVRHQRGQRSQRLLLDISALSATQAQDWLAGHLPHWVNQWPAGLLMECVAPTVDGWSTQRQAMAKALNMPMPLPDEVVLVVHEDILVSLTQAAGGDSAVPRPSSFLHAHRHLDYVVQIAADPVPPAQAQTLLQQWLDGGTMAALPA